MVGRAKQAVNYTTEHHGTPGKWLKSKGSQRRYEQSSDAENEEPDEPSPHHNGTNTKGRNNKAGSRADSKSAKGKASKAASKDEDVHKHQTDIESSPAVLKHAQSKGKSKTQQRGNKKGLQAEQCLSSPSESAGTHDNKTKAASKQGKRKASASSPLEEQQKDDGSMHAGKKAKTNGSHSGNNSEDGPRHSGFISMEELAKQNEQRRQEQEQQLKARSKQGKKQKAGVTSTEHETTSKDGIEPSSNRHTDSQPLPTNRNTDEGAGPSSMPDRPAALPAGLPAATEPRALQERMQDRANMTAGVRPDPTVANPATANASQLGTQGAQVKQAARHASQPAATQQALGPVLHSTDEQALLQPVAHQPPAATATQAYLMLHRQYTQLQELYTLLKDQKINQLGGLLEEQDDVMAAKVSALEKRAELHAAEAQQARQQAAAGQAALQQLAAVKEENITLKGQLIEKEMVVVQLQAEAAHLQAEVIALRSQLADTTALVNTQQAGGEAAVSDGPVDGGAVEVVQHHDVGDELPGDMAHDVGTGMETDEQAGDNSHPTTAAKQSNRMTSVGMQCPTPAAPSPGIGCQFPTPRTSRLNVTSFGAVSGIGLEPCLPTTAVTKCTASPMPSFGGQAATPVSNANAKQPSPSLYLGKQLQSGVKPNALATVTSGTEHRAALDSSDAVLPNSSANDFAFANAIQSPPQRSVSQIACMPSPSQPRQTGSLLTELGMAGHHLSDPAPELGSCNGNGNGRAASPSKVQWNGMTLPGSPHAASAIMPNEELRVPQPDAVQNAAVAVAVAAAAHQLDAVLAQEQGNTDSPVEGLRVVDASPAPAPLAAAAPAANNGARAGDKPARKSINPPPHIRRRAADIECDSVGRPALVTFMGVPQAPVAAVENPNKPDEPAVVDLNPRSAMKKQKPREQTPDVNQQPSRIVTASTPSLVLAPTTANANMHVGGDKGVKEAINGSESVTGHQQPATKNPTCLGQQTPAWPLLPQQHITEGGSESVAGPNQQTAADQPPAQLTLPNPLVAAFTAPTGPSPQYSWQGSTSGHEHSLIAAQNDKPVDNNNKNTGCPIGALGTTNPVDATAIQTETQHPAAAAAPAVVQPAARMEDAALVAAIGDEPRTPIRDSGNDEKEIVGGAQMEAPTPRTMGSWLQLYHLQGMQLQGGPAGTRCTHTASGLSFTLRQLSADRLSPERLELVESGITPSRRRSHCQPGDQTLDITMLEYTLHDKGTAKLPDFLCEFLEFESSSFGFFVKHIKEAVGSSTASVLAA